MTNIGDLIAGMRTAYNGRSNVFLEENLEIKEPYSIFAKWFADAKNNPKIHEPNAACLATSTKEGIPSARFMLCKGFGKEGFKFFSHYTSRKGQELEANPNAAMTFWWDALSRSVRIEGIVERLPFSEADEYFNSRPYPSQIGALCSDQSKPIPNRDTLSEIASDLKEKYKEGEVPRPEFWGGYILKPKSIEFWHGQTDRIHDRIKFRKAINNEEPDNNLTHAGVDGWIYERLCP